MAASLLGTVVAGGLAPTILQQTGSGIFVAVYIAVVIIAISAGEETYQTDIDRDAAGADTLAAERG